MPPPGFKPAVPVNQRTQTHTLDRAANKERHNGNITNEEFGRLWKKNAVFKFDVLLKKSAKLGFRPVTSKYET